MSRQLPDATTTHNICAFIRAGSFQWVAAMANGISKAKFAEWMRGETPEEKEFQYAVEQAYAQARVAAENKVFAAKPLAWLMRGPGRERPDAPGWTSQVAVTGRNGGPVEQAVSVGEAAAEDYSRLTTEELRQLRNLRDKVRAPATQEVDTGVQNAESDDGTAV